MDSQITLVTGRTLSAETQACLRYIKLNIVDETLNWKQKAGIIGGIIIGMGVVWPLMVIIFDGLLTPYAQRTFNYYIIPVSMSNNYFDPNIIMENFDIFAKCVNFSTMMLFVGLPMGIDAASRTATILSDIGKEDTLSFSIKKTRNHKILLLCTKGTLYFGTIIAGLLPVYYLYDSLLRCHDAWELGYIPISNNENDFKCSVSRDLLFNLNMSVDWFPYPPGCTQNWAYFPTENKALFYIGAPSLFFDTVLQYGYQLSAYAAQRIDAYFFPKVSESSRLSPLESTRQRYLAQFKDLKHVIYESDEDALNILYDEVFTQMEAKPDQHAKISFEEDAQNNALRILNVFNAFYRQHKSNGESEDSEDWRKDWASRIGWAIPLIATFGRMSIFQSIIEGVLGEFWYDVVNTGYSTYTTPSTGAIVLSYIFSVIFANIAQGLIEKEAVEESVYDLLNSQKIPNGGSHKHLRRGIKTWDYLYGAFQTLPYLAVGYALTRSKFEVLEPWTIFFLCTFGIADAFNNAVAFHDSNLNVVNAYDSLVATYWEPTTEYKKDKLIRMMRQLRKLFKDLHPDVLMEVDWKLQEARKNSVQTEQEDEYEQNEYEYKEDEDKYKDECDFEYDFTTDKYKYKKTKKKEDNYI